MARLLALGDCNTLGLEPCRHDTYAERFARHLGLECDNRGVTMTTTREGLRLLRDAYGPDCAVVTVQYGLVDSWRTFRFAPYVLYYPDHPVRKVARKLVKKYKTTCRRLGLNERVGWKHVVDPAEYRANVERLVRGAAGSTVYLLDTAPHHEAERNPFIERYNAILTEVAAAHDHCRKVDCYADVLAGLDRLYLDRTHLNGEAFDLIARRLVEAHEAAGPVAAPAREPAPAR